MNQSENFSEIVLSAKNGDDAAFALLYESFFTPVFRYVCSKLNDKSEAEDLTQNVFLRAYEAINRYQDQGKSPLAYFFTIARNLIINHSQKKRAVVLKNEESLEMFNLIPDERKNPHEMLEQKEQNIQIQELLKNLKPEYRKIVELKFLSGQSNTEIAKITGKSEANVRQIQVRALRKLQSHLTPPQNAEI